jgi:hypothetical protein
MTRPAGPSSYTIALDRPTPTPRLNAAKPWRVNREAWLQKAVRLLAADFKAAGYPIPAVRVSVGFPKGNVRKVIGQCWHAASTADGKPQVFISPTLGGAVDVLAVLVHELAHVVAGPGAGHGKDYAQVATTMGLTGRMTSTVAGPQLAARLKELAKRLGKYPHAALSLADPGTVKKQSTRLIKAECPTSGYTVRLTRKWIDEFGAPICPCCSEAMAVAS